MSNPTCAKCGSIPTGSLVPLRGQDVCIPCCNDDAGYWRARALRAEGRLDRRCMHGRLVSTGLVSDSGSIQTRCLKCSSIRWVEPPQPK